MLREGKQIEPEIGDTLEYQLSNSAMIVLAEDSSKSLFGLTIHQ